VVRQLAYSTELLVCINEAYKQYKQEEEKKLSQLNSTLSSSLYSSLFSLLSVFLTLLSVFLTLLSVFFIHTHKNITGGGYINIQLMGVRGSPPPCAKWEIR
jgi:hypothetical protein